MAKLTSAAFVRGLRAKGCRVEVRGDGRLYVGPRRLLTATDRRRLDVDQSRIRRLLRDRRARRQTEGIESMDERQIVGQVGGPGRWTPLFEDECDPMFRAGLRVALRKNRVRFGGIEE